MKLAYQVRGDAILEGDQESVRQKAVTLQQHNEIDQVSLFDTIFDV